MIGAGERCHFVEESSFRFCLEGAAKRARQDLVRPRLRG